MKRIISLFLVLCMCITVVPIDVYNAKVSTENIHIENDVQMLSESKNTDIDSENTYDVIAGVPAEYAIAKIDVDEALIEEQERKWEIINCADPEYHLENSYYFVEDTYHQDVLTKEEYAVLKQVAEEITSECTTQYEKIKAIVTYVSDTIYYDYPFYDYIEGREGGVKGFVNPYDVYVNKRTVCDGYERLVRVLCISIGIPCMKLNGDNHTYNAIYDSGQARWIFADATWCSQNQYLGTEEWIYNGYTLSRFDMSPAEIAELSNHETYSVGGILDERDMSAYYVINFGEYSSETQGFDGYAVVTNPRMQNVTVLKDCYGFPIKYICPFDFSYASCDWWETFDIYNILKSIDLSNIRLESIGDRLFSGCSSLEEIDLSNTQLESIGYGAFYGCNSLKEIDLSNTQLENIGEDAFSGCSSLEEIDLSNIQLESIGESAFSGCSSLEEINLSNTQVEEISEDTFMYCSNLKKIIFPSTLKKICDYGFYSCGIWEVDLSNTQVEEIGRYAFSGCSSLKDIIFPLTLKKICDYGLRGCGVVEVDLSNTQLEEIGNEVFSRCGELRSISFPLGLKKIAEKAFWCCDNLEEIDISNTQVEEIGNEAFSTCYELEKIVFPLSLRIIGDYAFQDTCGLENIVLPNGIQEIGNYAFSITSSAPHLQVRTTLSENILGINRYVWSGRNVVFSEYFYTVLYDGNGATSGTMWESVQGSDVQYELSYNYFRKEGYTFTGWNTKPDGTGRSFADKAIVKKIGSSDGETITLYAQWKKLDVPLEKINRATVYLSQDSYCYNGDYIKPSVTVYLYGVKLEENVDYTLTYENNKNAGKASIIVTGKGNYTGRVTKKFTISAISIENTKISIPDCNYNGKAKKPIAAVKLGKVILKEGVDYSVTYSNNKNIGTAKVTITGKGNYTGTISDTFSIKAKEGTTFNSGKYKYKVTGKSTVAFAGVKSKSTTTVTIPKTVKYGGKTFKVTSIADKAFYKNTKVKKVTIGANVTTIGKSTFEGCTKLSSVTIGSKVTKIGDKAFKKCTALTKITIPSKVKTLGKEVFSGCKKLKTITVKSTKLTSVGKNAFKSIYSKATIKVPSKKLSTYKKLFKGKGQGGKVKIKK